MTKVRQILKILHPDRRPKQESYILEIEFLINDIKTTLQNLDEWTKPAKPEKGFVNMMDEVLIYPDPLGVVLVMGAWNYPLQLPLVPFGAAIAAGNVAILKPSEISENCAKFIADNVPKYLDNVSRPWNLVSKVTLI
jgi:acyl-CoA reductase-like NAD-dependent aldehyde dehydrogenase